MKCTNVVQAVRLHGLRNRAGGPPAPRSELAVAHFEMGGFAEVGAAAANPIGDPLDEPLRRHTRLAEQTLRLLGIAQNGIVGFAALERDRLPEQPPELLRHAAYAQELRAREV